jgi:hypothetical protein
MGVELNDSETEEDDIVVPQAVSTTSNKTLGIKKCFILFIIWKRGMCAFNMLLISNEK